MMKSDEAHLSLSAYVRNIRQVVSANAGRMVQPFEYNAEGCDKAAPEFHKKIFSAKRLNALASAIAPHPMALYFNQKNGARDFELSSLTLLAEA